jgi:hypothetical protein
MKIISKHTIISVVSEEKTASGAIRWTLLIDHQGGVFTLEFPMSSRSYLTETELRELGSFFIKLADDYSTGRL